MYKLLFTRPWNSKRYQSAKLESKQHSTHEHQFSPQRIQLVDATTVQNRFVKIFHFQETRCYLVTTIMHSLCEVFLAVPRVHYTFQNCHRYKAPIMSRFDLFFILVDEQNEVIDYAIARKIVDLHSHRAEAAKRPYPIEDVLKYLLFCKLIKPKMTPEAEELIVQQYW